MSQTTVGKPWYRQPSLWARRLYNWVIHWASTPYAVPALFIVAFVESSIFPIPPDVLLMAMALGRPAQAFFYAFICSLGSVIGGLLGYVIGYFLWEAARSFFIPNVFSQELFDLVQKKYELYSFWVVFIAAFTPIPYKIFTIAGGVCHINLGGFILASAIGRSARFFIVATILYFLGEKAKRFIEKHFEWLTLAFGILLAGGFVLIKKVM
ncbi:MAG: YqaA family protein [Candidatus Omnitrophota bacterium]|nr:YqaA family protein [Candidatus Omnitrophota bacterium]MDZ4242595.1 YqaA family protein [Candidatus Omnitrophota bacterium]